MEPLRPERFGYVSLRVPDLDATSGFFEQFVGLEESLRRPGEVFLRGGFDHHWIHLHEGEDVALTRLAYEVRDDAVLDALAKRLSDAGVHVEEGSDLARDRVDRFLRFQDPDGYDLELYTTMVRMPHPVRPRVFRIDACIHALVFVRDMATSYDFYSRLLGFEASDWVERIAAFLRCGIGYHHSLALIQDESRHGLDHLCFLAPSLDDVMIARTGVLNAGLPSRADIKRHSPSGSVSFYFSPPEGGLTVEVCWDHMRIGPDDRHVARVLPQRPETTDLWQVTDGPAPAMSRSSGPLDGTTGR
jgi:2,3-dihydroxy-p-cumate/2,3-dihydroxybenzoate 3,4-dioxygenase